MAINFGAYIQRTYRGQIYAAPFKPVADPSQSALVAPIAINWTDYAAALTQRVGININLAQSQANGVIQQISSVVIDNLLNTSPVYVQFPDTGWTVKCPANARVASPVVTNYVAANVFTDDIQAGNQTKLYFSNIPANYFAERGDGGQLTARLITGPDGTFVMEPDVHGEMTTFGHLDVFGTGSQTYGQVFAAQNLNNAISGIRLKTVKLYLAKVMFATSGNDFQVALQSAPAGTLNFNNTYVNVTAYGPASRQAVLQQPVIELEDQHIAIPSNVDVYCTFPTNIPLRARLTWFLAYTYV